MSRYQCDIVDKRPLRQSCAPMMQHQLATLSTTMDARHYRGNPKGCASYLLKSPPTEILDLQNKAAMAEEPPDPPGRPEPLKRRKRIELSVEI